MSPLYGVLVGASMLGLLFIARKPGKMGRLGASVRDSDHWAWQLAVEDKEAELRELRAQEPPL